MDKQILPTVGTGSDLGTITAPTTSGAVGQRVKRRARPFASMRYDWAMIALFTWFIIGTYIDGWAHNHDKAENFFTLYHAVMYAGFTVVGALTVAAGAYFLRRGYPWRLAMPAGYELSFIGVVTFFLGGVFDMFWHLAFGVETGVEPLITPSHLLLLFGGVLIAPGPLRAAFYRHGAGRQPRDWLSQVPMIISLAYVLATFQFMTNYLNPFGRTGAANNYERSSGLVRETVGYDIAAVLVQTALFMGLVLLVLHARQWSLPIGTLTIVMGINTALMVCMKTHYVTTGLFPMFLAGLGGGILGDLLLWWLKPSAIRPVALRAFAFGFPALLYSCYFLCIAVSGEGIHWSTHLWTGAIILAGCVGIMLSFLVVPTKALLSGYDAGG